ncbi:MAG: prephenate dehydrogenase/arogenate dehydrogenase family protein, partial [Methylococcales bacterium]
MFNKLCIFGVGLIGGSVAKAARANGLAKTIVGIGRAQDADNLVRAKELGVIDECYIGSPRFKNFNNYKSFRDSLAHADCVVIATPVASIEDIFKALKDGGHWSVKGKKNQINYWSDTTIYTDVGSTKGSVIAAAERVFGFVPNNLVPAHPIAGAEQSGVEAALVDLFTNKRLIITPTTTTNSDDVQKIRNFWQGMGAVVSEMDAQHHDSILAATSHLPHILAFALVDMLGHKDEQTEIFKYAAGGFRDFTRIASSDPTMWVDICKANKQEILPLIEQLSAELAKIHGLLARDDYQQLFSTFAYAKSARQRFLNQFEDPNMTKSITFHIKNGGKLQGEA